MASGDESRAVGRPGDLTRAGMPPKLRMRPHAPGAGAWALGGCGEASRERNAMKIALGRGARIAFVATLSLLLLQAGVSLFVILMCWQQAVPPGGEAATAARPGLGSALISLGAATVLGLACLGL